MLSAVLRLHDLRKRFGDVTAVDGLTLEIERGEVFGLLGPNGAGKSTTIALAVGLLTPDGGRVEFEGLGPPTNPAVRKHLGVAPQALALYDDLTGEENLRFFGRLYGLGGSGLRSRTSAVLDLVGLAPRRHHRVGGYSGGMKRRLNLAVAMVHDPPLLLLDEPTAGVDPQSRNNILEIVRNLAEQGRTIVYTTHYMEEASKLCSRVGVIDRGRLLALGPVPRLIAEHGGRSVVSVQRASGEERRQTDDPLREISAILSGDAAKDVVGVHIDRPDLESVFLNLTGRSLRD